ncbi:MAG: aminotransferase class I/II-fold pyridoxal phosphate-dependent enzyme, partial [Candidatus Acetothermia bacterium]
MSKTYLKPAPEPPAIRDAMARASRRQERGEPVYDFSSGNIGRLLMEYNPFQDISVDTGRMPESFEPVAKALARGMQKAFAGKPQGLSYSPTGGTEAQRRTAIQYFKKIHGVPLSEEDTHRVMITVGGQQSMAAALRSLSPEAKVIAPRWDYAPVTGIASDEPWEFCKLSPQDGLGFSLDDLREEATDGAVFYTSMPNNPSGYVSAEKLRKAAEIMVQAGGGVIWDAPYLFTMFRIIGGQAKFDPDFLENQVEKFAVVAEEFSENMCITSSLSKSCLIAGLRFGFATAPPDWIQNMEAIVGRENLSSPTASFIMGDEVFQAFLEEE